MASHCPGRGFRPHRYRLSLVIGPATREGYRYFQCPSTERPPSGFPVDSLASSWREARTVNTKAGRLRFLRRARSRRLQRRRFLQLAAAGATGAWFCPDRVRAAPGLARVVMVVDGQAWNGGGTSNLRRACPRRSAEIRRSGVLVWGQACLSTGCIRARGNRRRLTGPRRRDGDTMPPHDFECRDCRQRFETVWQPGGKTPAHPECDRQRKIRR